MNKFTPAWEDKVRLEDGQELLVQANWKWDYDWSGKQYVDITEIRAYDSKNIEICVDDTLMESVAQRIQDTETF